MVDVEQLKQYREDWKNNISEIRKTMNKIKKAHTTILLCYGMIAIFIVLALSLLLAYQNGSAASFSLALAVVFLIIHRMNVKKTARLKKQIKTLMQENDQIKKITNDLKANVQS
ncbi:MAG: hypothetical protein ACFHVJ_04765 [Aestuariibacter sp.]